MTSSLKVPHPSGSYKQPPQQSPERCPQHQPPRRQHLWIPNQLCSLQPQLIKSIWACQHQRVIVSAIFPCDRSHSPSSGQPATCPQITNLRCRKLTIWRTHISRQLRGRERSRSAERATTPSRREIRHCRIHRNRLARTRISTGFYISSTPFPSRPSSSQSSRKWQLQAPAARTVAEQMGW